MPISPTLPADGESNWDVTLNAALDVIVDGVNDNETAIAAKLDSSAAPELIRDTIGTALVAGTNVTITPNDGSDTITIAAAGLDAEGVRDTIGAALVAGTNVSISVNDGSDTITISASGGGGGGATDLEGLSDVDLTSPADNQFLRYTGTEWVNEAVTQDDIGDGSTYKQYSSTEKTKLAGIASGATANSSDATLLARANHTGTQSADTLTDGTTNKAFLATERTKLSGIATSATANSSDATLLARANHTGSQTASTISDFATTVRATTGSDTAAGSLELATDAEAVTGTDTARAVTPANVAAVVAVTRARYSAVNAQTGTTYAPVLSDEGKLVTLSNASAITVTMPQDSATAFPVGATIDFLVIGAGMATFSAGTGATVNPTSVTRAQWSAVTAIKRAANTWTIVGDLA
ncbi:cell pole-organizing protein PopZ [Agromyces sp. 3263]|uniref:hypothetical protein n=1 Tax=Agromyces sp. 3263 TaxID=2817750 RepID=UPI0028628FDF|nr:hypothetical protein [Agromyces sp. 3263]MDR6907462.1 cell pole-organizing protein PopZ [Agromyces sp. 3263]